MDGKLSRSKGKRGERMLANELRETFPEFSANIRRGWQSREGDDEADVLGVPGFWFESKYGKLPNPRAALLQATRDSNEGRKGLPIAVIRDNRKDPFAVMKWSDLLSILREVMTARGKYDKQDVATDNVRTGSGRGLLSGDTKTHTRRVWRIRLRPGGTRFGISGASQWQVYSGKGHGRGGKTTTGK